MELTRDLLKNPRAIGIACAFAATGLGLAYMAAAGAPMRYLAVNIVALFLGLAGFAIVSRIFPPRTFRASATLVALGGALLATALLGVSVEGASRWVKLGPIVLQPSLIVLPLMVVAFATTRDLLSTIGMVLGAIAIAMQPDRAMAGVLLAGLTVLATSMRDRWTFAAFTAAAIAFASTMLRVDMLPAVPYVDQILYSAFDVHLLAGLAVMIGVVVLIVPAIVGQPQDRGSGVVYAVFGAAWLAVVVAAAFGNYPTPLVGYGGSAILGYLLSLTMLPPTASALPSNEKHGRDRKGARITQHDLEKRISLA